MPVRGGYGHIEGTVGAVPTLPTIGGMDTLRGPVYLRTGCTWRNVRAPYCSHTVPRTVTRTGPIPFCPYEPVPARYRPRYRFARTGPVPVCPRVARASPYQPVPPRLLFLLLKCCFTSTETVGLFGTGAQDGHLDFHTAPEL